VGQHDALGRPVVPTYNQRGDTLRGVDGNRFRFDCLVKRANGDGPSPAASWITALCRLACSRACAETLVV